MSELREDARKIYESAIKANLPDSAVREALFGFEAPRGRLFAVSIGKAAWRMAHAAEKTLREQGVSIYSGIVVTKYEHSEGEIEGFEIYEAAHPVPDRAGILATERVLDATADLTENDTVLFLVSGGGSALFESPKCTEEQLSDLTRQLLSSGADINEMNAVRKHISKVKGGRFAEHISPARVFAVVLSDVIGDRLDTVASGPCAPDLSRVEDVRGIIERYELKLTEAVAAALSEETPKCITNAEHKICGSVAELCRAAKLKAEELGYKTEILRSDEGGMARDVGRELARLAVKKSDTDAPLAFIIGGETVVKLKGQGLGGRNQETALAAAPIIAGQSNIAVFSVGSDGTDGPTDAAGGFADGGTYGRMKTHGIDAAAALEDNDSYHALKASGDLIVTGPTGTNVNDFAMALILPK